MGDNTLIHLSRLIGLQRKLDVIAQNVANIGTDGFRARELSFREYLKPENGIDENGQKERPLSLTDASVPLTTTARGELHATGSTLDLAIDGDAFFVVKTDHGELYTKSGAFLVDRNGNIVTTDGYPVQGKTGPLQTGPTEGPLEVGADGIVTSKQRVLGQLSLVRFARPELLQPVGGNLLKAEESPQPAPLSKVMSGVVEKSNVSGAREMARLGEITRAYELAGGLLKNSQDVSDMNRLAEVPD
ncbi:flagellar hook-basal body complex protein [Bradyrhizobium vignae]|uniref:Flagellar hook-basal body protein n=1 Tax=Bradyrhizobium vignae TaxID=1549949 RepID=A0A2U3PVD3_9BRAD|nr:flagellar hook-basal body complex protein [Bradyrhizobium vignae]SPP93068.1 Flagellar hook-basal body protein [Bradyrhizobium vignae]